MTRPWTGRRRSPRSTWSTASRGARRRPSTAAPRSRSRSGCSPTSSRPRCRSWTAHPRAPRRHSFCSSRSSSSTDHLGQLRSEAADLDAAPVDPGQVVTPAYVKDSGPLGTGLVAALLGAIVGAGLGLAWGLSRVRLAGWVRGPDDLDPVDVPVLAALGSRDPTPEDLGRLRAGLLSLDIRRPLVVVVTGLAGETCSPKPLASSLARSNHEAVLVHTGTPDPEAVKVGSGRPAARPDRR